MLTYGMPDFSSAGAGSDDDQQKLCRAVEVAIGRFEPRIRNVTVRPSIRAGISKGASFGWSLKAIYGFTRSRNGSHSIRWSSRIQVNSKCRRNNAIMPDPLEIQYENELTFIRRLGTEFAHERPKIADRLLLDRESGASEDPHVERLIEAFAFLTARIRLKLNDEFPELTESFLETLYPHYLAPIPSMSVVEFKVDPVRCNFPQGHTIEKGSRLLTPSIRGVACEFRTTSPLTLWPLEIVSAHYLLPLWPGHRALVQNRRIKGAHSIGAGVRRRSISLRVGTRQAAVFFKRGLRAFVSKLYELIFNHVTQVMIRGEASSLEGPPLTLRPNALQPVGFAPDEGMLPYGNRSFPGYRLLAEYFCFPSKFMFFEIEGLQGVRRRGWKKRLEVLLFLNRSMPNLEAQVRPRPSG